VIKVLMGTETILCCCFYVLLIMVKLDTHWH